MEKRMARKKVARKVAEEETEQIIAGIQTNKSTSAGQQSHYLTENAGFFY